MGDPAKVLHEYESHAAVRRHGAEERPERRKTARGSSYSDDQAALLGMVAGRSGGSGRRGFHCTLSNELSSALEPPRPLIDIKRSFDLPRIEPRRALLALA